MIKSDPFETKAYEDFLLDGKEIPFDIIKEQEEILKQLQEKKTKSRKTAKDLKRKVEYDLEDSPVKQVKTNDHMKLPVKKTNEEKEITVHSNGEEEDYFDEAEVEDDFAFLKEEILGKKKKTLKAGMNKKKQPKNAYKLTKKEALDSSGKKVKTLLPGMNQKKKPKVAFNKANIMPIVNGLEANPRIKREDWNFAHEVTAHQKPSVNFEALITAEDGFEQKEIPITAFHRSRKAELETNAQKLGLITDFGYDVVLVSGPPSEIVKFIVSLYEVESDAKRSLYPEYWDFHDLRPFSKIPLSADGPEYKKISDLLLNTMDRPLKIVSIERIQNKYLMEHYVNHMQKKMELTPEINRRLLFHGTKHMDPAVIYKSFDVGFDLQYVLSANSGKGLYFAGRAEISCNEFEHPLKNGNCQVMVADVFLGRNLKKRYHNGVKAPEGYDSIYCDLECEYVIFNNFHSYPLYLIEYQDKDRYGFNNQLM